MREQLIQYVNLLFAGAADSDDIREEILHNTLERYDDLIDQGKAPEAAYRLAISGIGDISEILGTMPVNASPSRKPTAEKHPQEAAAEETPEEIHRKKLRSGAIVLYILSILPLIILDEFGADIIGICLTLLMVAAATYIMLITSKKDADEDEKESFPNSPQNELKKSIGNLIWIIGLAAYFILSFGTGAWYITWIIFPIVGCIQGLVNAIIDLKEANKHEI